MSRTRAYQPVARLPWRAHGESSDQWSALRLAPAENRGFVETQRYVFEKPGAGWSLHVDDEPLADDPEDHCCWMWEPGFFAGEVTAELLDRDGKRAGLFLLDVAPDPSKIGREIFARMVGDLWSEDPRLVLGSEPATTNIGELGAVQDPWLAFARLRQYAPEFTRALVPLCVRPRRALRVRRDSAALHRVRRVDRGTATALLRSPAAAMVFAGAGATSALAVNTTYAFGQDSRLDVPVVEETVDASANRSVLALVLALLRRARALDQRLQRLVDTEPRSETRTSLAVRWPARKRFLADLITRLKIVLRQSPFAQVQRAEVTAGGLTTIAADPIYSRAWSRGWRALRHGVESDTTSERLWVSPSWEIYERWCFLRVGKLLAAIMPAWGWHRLVDPHRWVGFYASRRGELRLQPTFSSRRRQSDKMWSVSRERVPDLVLTVADPGGVRFIVLDAKYRTSRADVLDAMESAHVYQDSLRIGSQRAEASLLLIPSGGGASWLENPAFQAEHRVGIHVLSPDGETTLPVLVTETLEGCPAP
jgi:hypothetical protein